MGPWEKKKGFPQYEKIQSGSPEKLPREGVNGIPIVLKKEK